MKRWYALYTKPKHEGSVSYLLRNAGIETLNAKIRVKKYVRKRFSDVVEQLFPCYVFALYDIETEGHMVKFTRGIKYVVGKDSPVEVPRQIIDAIRERMEGDIVEPEKEIFAEGDRVQVREGAFKDFYGIFQRELGGKERAMILLDVLHSKLEIETRSITRA